jgi:hypothetical protein
MIAQNLKAHYRKTQIITNVISIACACILLDCLDAFFSQILKVEYRFIFATIAFFSYLNLKYFHPFYFYKTLKCPRCQNQYHDAKIGTSIRMSLLNEVHCQYCKYQGKFEF